MGHIVHRNVQTGNYQRRDPKGRYADKTLVGTEQTRQGVVERREAVTEKPQVLGDQRPAGSSEKKVVG